MSSLRQQGRYFYVRIIRQAGLKPREVKIPLKTTEQRDAFLRKREVDKHEAEIKAGIDVQFPWLLEPVGGETPTLTLKEGIKRYLTARQADRLRPATLDNYRFTLNRFADVVGGNISLDELDTTYIDQFKIWCLDKLSPTTVNIHLRSLKTFLNWSQEREFL